MFEHKAVGMRVETANTALVFTDIQNDFLSPEGGAYPLIAESLAKNDTAENIEKLFAAARECGMLTLLSPHYYYPHDHRWEAPLTPLEDLAHRMGLLGRTDPLSLEGFEGSGADFPQRYKPYIKSPGCVVCSPHKVYGASTNDLVIQLRRRKIERVIMGGPVGNLCVEAHMRDLVENGFEVAMVRDATAGTSNEEGDGYQAALVNWRFMAHALWTTEEAIRNMRAAAQG
jgi:nicotinamidase-related amidase